MKIAFEQSRRLAGQRKDASCADSIFKQGRRQHPVSLHMDYGVVQRAGGGGGK
jgi:hypothetical protein